VITAACDMDADAMMPAVAVVVAAAAVTAAARTGALGFRWRAGFLGRACLPTCTPVDGLRPYVALRNGDCGPGKPSQEIRVLDSVIYHPYTGRQILSGGTGNFFFFPGFPPSPDTFCYPDQLGGGISPRLTS